MEVTNTAAATPLTTPNGAKESKGALSSDFETFLKMLTTQMQNQDPLEPMKSDQLSVQLATFSGVEQQVLTNDLLGNLGQQIGAMSLSQLAGWVGMDARSDAPRYFDGGPITVALEPAALADQAAVVVKDHAGNEVSRAPVPLSSTSYSWDGLASNGTGLSRGSYTFELESSLKGEVIETKPAEAYARVTEVRNDAGKTVLVLAGGAKIASDQVTALREGS